MLCTKFVGGEQWQYPPQDCATHRKNLTVAYKSPKEYGYKIIGESLVGTKKALASYIFLKDNKYKFWSLCFLLILVWRAQIFTDDKSEYYVLCVICGSGFCALIIFYLQCLYVSIVRELLRTFEFWFLIGNGIVYLWADFTIWIHKHGFYFTFLLESLNILICMVAIILLDAMPLAFFTPRMKFWTWTAVLLGCVSYCMFLIFFDDESYTLNIYKARWLLSDIRASAFTTFTILNGRIWLSCLRHPYKCILIRQRLVREYDIQPKRSFQGEQNIFQSEEMENHDEPDDQFRRVE